MQTWVTAFGPNLHNVNTNMLNSDPMYRIFCPDIEKPTREDALATYEDNRYKREILEEEAAGEVGETVVGTRGERIENAELHAGLAQYQRTNDTLVARPVAEADQFRRFIDGLFDVG